MFKVGAVSTTLLAVTLVGLVVMITDVPAAAHGIGGRSDLPLPIWQVTWAAVCVVIASFAAVGLLWRKPQLRAASEGTPIPLPGWLMKWVLVVSRTIGLILFAVVVFAALRGNVNPSVNIAPYTLYIILWVGMSVLSVLIGDVWRVFNPIPVLAKGLDRLFSASIRNKSNVDSLNNTQPDTSRYELLGGGTDPDLATDASESSLGGGTDPAKGHHWWAAATLAGFAWLELAYHTSDSPRAVAVFVIAYTVVMLLGAAIRGVHWVRHADGFGVLFNYFGAIGPLSVDMTVGCGCVGH